MQKRPMPLSEVEVLLQTYGYHLQRITGSHRQYRNAANGQRLTLVCENRPGAEVSAERIENTLKDIRDATRRFEAMQAQEPHAVSTMPSERRKRYQRPQAPRRERSKVIDLPHRLACSVWPTIVPALLNMTIQPRKRASMCAHCCATDGPMYTFTAYLPEGVSEQCIESDPRQRAETFMVWYTRQHALGPTVQIVFTICQSCIQKSLKEHITPEYMQRWMAERERPNGMSMLSVWVTPTTGGIQETFMITPVQTPHKLVTPFNRMASDLANIAVFGHFYPTSADDLVAQMADPMRIPF